jgi:hypothetical protein
MNVDNLKFRVWDKAERKMLLWDTSEFLRNNFYRLLADKANKYEFMMWSGQLDDLGAEVYEGDIIRMLNYKCPPNVVQFIPSAFVRVYSINNKTYTNLLGAKCKMIGNIHQHALVINKEKQTPPA